MAIDNKSGYSALILMVACLNFSRLENTSLSLRRYSRLGSALNEARVMNDVLTSILPNDTSHWMAPARDYYFHVILAHALSCV